MKCLDEIQEAIECGKPKDTERLIRQALEEGQEPGVILEEAMVPAMRKAGEEYRSEEGDIPRILLAARSMQKGLHILEPLLEKDPERHPGTVILGTVEGDLHDVGKNLVAIMLRSAGFEVVDLGVDVSGRMFLRAIREHPEADIVCISSLLTTSMPGMRRIVRQLKKTRGFHMKIMVGGGSVTQEFADEIGADAYTTNAVDAVDVAKRFVQDKSRKKEKKPEQ